MKTQIQTNIRKVTVFRDGARVTREGAAKVKSGEATLIVGGITEYAQEDSFRVKGKGAAVLRGIDVRRTTQTFIPENELERLLEELKVLEDEEKRIDSRLELQQKRLTLHEGIASDFSAHFGKWFASGEASLEQLEAMDRMTMKHLLDAKEKIRALQEEKNEVGTKIAAIRANINRVRGERKIETHYEVHIQVDSKEGTELELEVTYQIAQAGWNPIYDVDLGEQKATLKRIAQVYNSSLEDWNDVKLSVSTASAKPVQAIEPTPFFIDAYTPYAAARTRSFGIGGGMPEAKALKDEMEDEEMADEVPAMEAEPAPEIIESYAEVSETEGGIVVYDVPGRVTVTSDEDPHPVTLTEESFNSKKLHFWNAYAMSEVVAQDEITNGDSVLLPGPVKVYAKGEFTGESYLGLIAPREKFTLGTRSSYDVKAEKKLVSKETDKAGFTRGKTKRGYKYALEIESYSKDSVELRVVDRIPHSTSEKIHVELLNSQPTPNKNELGVLEWTIVLEPSQQRTISYEYEVEWERDVRIHPPLP